MELMVLEAIKNGCFVDYDGNFGSRRIWSKDGSIGIAEILDYDNEPTGDWQILDENGIPSYDRNDIGLSLAAALQRIDP